MKPLLLFFAAASLSAPASAATIAIVHGKVATIANSVPIENGTVVIDGDRIVAVGANIAVPEGARVIDAKGGWVTPGLFAAYSQIGIVEVDAVRQTNDTKADKSPYSAAIDAAMAFNPLTTAIAVTRVKGVTRAAIVPDTGSDIFGGQGFIANLSGSVGSIDRRQAFQFIEMGEGGAALAGGSRGALYARLADAFAEAAAYARNPAGYGFGRDKGSLLTKADAAALVKVVNGSQMVIVKVDRASDIRQVLGLKRQYPAMRPILLGAAEGWTVAADIAAAGVPVLATVTTNLPERFETLAATQSNAGRMIRAGVKVAIVSLGSSPGFDARLMPQQAGNLMAQDRIPGGVTVSHAEALAAMTRVPAEIYGLGGELGTIETGKRADVVVWSGDPIELSSAPTAVFIDGAEQSEVTRQTKLRDRYNPMKQDNLPKQYSR